MEDECELTKKEREMIAESMLAYIDDFDTFVIKVGVNGDEYSQAIKKLRKKFKDLKKGKNIDKVINMDKIDELKEALQHMRDNQ